MALRRDEATEMGGEEGILEDKVIAGVRAEEMVKEGERENEGDREEGRTEKEEEWGDGSVVSEEKD